MGQVVFESPAADLSAVELEGVQTQRLGGREAVGAGRAAAQALPEEVQDGLGLGRGVAAAGRAGTPERAGAAAAGEDMADERERGRVAMDELLVLFKDAVWTPQNPVLLTTRLILLCLHRDTVFFQPFTVS